MTKPFDFQKTGIRRISYFRGNCILADEMGLGKTLQSLVWVKKRMVKNRTLPCLVVCPAYLKENWQREALKHINMDAVILEGRETTNQDAAN